MILSSIIIDGVYSLMLQFYENYLKENSRLPQGSDNFCGSLIIGNF
jgi:hypothetical protein